MAVDDVRARVEAAVARFVQERAPWQSGETIVAAVSGGPDSLCMLGALLSLKEAYPALAPGRIVVAHLDHGLRGEAGHADSEWVRAFAAQLGVPCVTHAEDVRALARRERRSLEDAARQARYAFLRRVAAEYGAARICVGHTRDDQVETIVMHFVRGSGLTGLAGMRPLTGDVARPLLVVARTDTVAYCAARGWQPRLDVTNADIAFVRNRVRHELLPELERYNPNLRDTLLRNAELIREDDRYLEEQAAVLWALAARSEAQGHRGTDVPAHDSGGTEVPAHDAESGLKSAEVGTRYRAEAEAVDVLRFSLPAVRNAPAALRRRLIRQAVERLTTAAGVTLGAEHIQSVERLIQSGQSGSSLDLPGRLRVALGYDTLSFERQRRSVSARRLAPDHELEVRLAVPGSVALPGLGWRVTAAIEPAGEAPEAVIGWLGGHKPGGVADLDTGYHLPEAEAVLDADVAGDTLTVRTWRAGDRMQPLGMTTEKKLQDVYSDAKVPRSLRRRLPLVYGRSHLLWVAGLRLDERARITPETHRVLRLRLEPLAPAENVGHRAASSESE